MQPNQVKPLTDASGQGSPVSQGSGEQGDEVMPEALLDELRLRGGFAGAHRAALAQALAVEQASRLGRTVDEVELHDIQLEFYNTDARSAVNRYWESPSLPKQYIPQSQLYPLP